MKIILLSIFLTISFCFNLWAQESLKVLEKPIPLFTEAQRELNICAQGTVTLRVEFLANGQIGKVLPISGLPYGLTESAVEAVKQIKFIPAKKEGNSATIFKQIQYSFTLDGGWKNTSNQFESKKDNSKNDEKAEAVIIKAIEKLGGEKYLRVKSQIGRGQFSVMRDGSLLSFQSFVDVIVFPDKERTEFKGLGSKNVQTNVGKNGWIFDGDAETVKEQDEAQIKNFVHGINVSLDNLLRGGWRSENAVLSYVGKRQASLGKRNDVVKLTYPDGLSVEFEFSDEGMPVKSIYKRTNADGEEVKEEDRYAQFVEVSGIKAPFIIDRFTNNVQSSRINYESIEFNKTVPDSIFAKPKNAKEAKKDLKL
ncbi:MAG TPA: energy transducer TonB [Pyrinomonadaceae bacterium]|jgi:hypothetical protein